MKRRNFLQLIGVAPLALAEPSRLEAKAVSVTVKRPIEENPHEQLPILEKCYCVVGRELLLIDQWPGVPMDGFRPADWTTMDEDPYFPLGTKRAIYDDINYGWACMMYLYYNRTPTLGRKESRLCCMDFRPKYRITGKWSCVTNLCNRSQLNLPLAVRVGKRATGYYGWFWVGGVCPVTVIPALKRNMDLSYFNNAETTLLQQ